MNNHKLGCVCGFCKNKRILMGADDITQIPPLTDIEWADLEKAFEDFTLDKQAKCECGAEAVGSDRHSDWCKKA